MQRVNITLPEDLLVEMDRVAEEEATNRSELIRKAMKSYFRLKQEEKERIQRQNDIQQAIVIQDRIRATTPTWDTLKELRHQREMKR
ncbi:MAG: ribbon-helix-helix protein, CopG family [Candidatus Latescibacteria bacterium]|nr:ribbon-helix-helix protein, CopG family [Candidatus Latescibacterota bacterium]